MIESQFLHKWNVKGCKVCCLHTSVLEASSKLKPTYVIDWPVEPQVSCRIRCVNRPISTMISYVIDWPVEPQISCRIRCVNRPISTMISYVLGLNFVDILTLSLRFFRFLPTTREGNVFRGVCNSVLNRLHGYSVTAHLCYSVVGKNPTGMLSCVSRFLVMKSKHMYIVLYYAICLFTVSMYRPVSFNHIFPPTFIPIKWDFCSEPMLMEKYAWP